MLGNPYPEAMLDGMTRLTFQRWIAFDRVEPFGDERDDLRMAIGTAAAVSALSGQKMKPGDFMPDFTPKTQNVDKMQAAMKLFAAQTARHLNGYN